MELSERFIQQLESENFANVYEWQDKPNTVYPPHTHTGKMSLYVTDGMITFTIESNEKKVNVGERLDIEAGVEHSAIVGPEGVIFIVGEE